MQSSTERILIAEYCLCVNSELLKRLRKLSEDNQLICEHGIKSEGFLTGIQKNSQTGSQTGIQKDSQKVNQTDGLTRMHTGK